MYSMLEQVVKQGNRQGNFLFDSKVHKGSIIFLNENVVVIQVIENTQSYDYILHPNNVIIVRPHQDIKE